jgi:hypothetical protein
MMTDEALFDSVTRAPAGSWRLQGRGRGTLTPGSEADIVVANRKTAARGYDAWFEINPSDIALVMKSGSVRLCDEERYRQLQRSGFDCTALSKVRLDGSAKYVHGDLPGLMAAIKGFAPQVAFPVQGET